MKIRIPRTKILGYFDGTLYRDQSTGRAAKSPSGFARIAYPDNKSINGWKAAEFQNRQGEWKPLDSLRTSKDPLAPFRKVAPRHPKPTPHIVSRETHEDSYLKWYY
jgi:hypothetical protein